MTSLTLPPLQTKFWDLKAEMQTELIERVEIIDTSVLAVVAGLHHFQLGTPGVAKSMLVRNLVSHIGGLNQGQYFEMMLTRFSAPEELWGPFDISGLKETPSRYRRNTNLMAPEAWFWFLDEIWKANSSILNSLLQATNERIFRNDGRIHDIPLWSMFCASNEMPEGEELNAMFDRISFRHIAKEIQEPFHFIQVLKLKNSDRKGEILTVDEIKQAAAEAEEVEIPEEVYEMMVSVRGKLRSEGIEPTTRRFRDSLRVIRAQAWMRGEKVADIEDMHPLRHVLWIELDHIPVVEKMLRELSNPLDKEADDILEVIEEIGADLERTLQEEDVDGSIKNKKGVEFHGKIERAKKDLKTLKAKAIKNKRKTTKIDNAQDRLVAVTSRMLTDLFKVNPELEEATAEAIEDELNEEG